MVHALQINLMSLNRCVMYLFLFVIAQLCLSTGIHSSSNPISTRWIDSIQCGNTGECSQLKSSLNTILHNSDCIQLYTHGSCSNHCANSLRALISKNLWIKCVNRCNWNRFTYIQSIQSWIKLCVKYTSLEPIQSMENSGNRSENGERVSVQERMNVTDSAELQAGNAVIEEFENLDESIRKTDEFSDEKKVDETRRENGISQWMWVLLCVISVVLGVFLSMKYYPSLYSNLFNFFNAFWSNSNSVDPNSSSKLSNRGARRHIQRADYWNTSNTVNAAV